MKYMVTFKVMLFAFIFLVQGQLCVGQTAAEIIERYIDTVSNGDIGNWDKIKSVFLESEVFYGQQQYGQSGPIFSPTKASYHRTYRVFPDKLKTEIYADSTFTELQSSWWYQGDRTVTQFGNMKPIVQHIQENSLWDLQPVEIYRFVKESKSFTNRGVRKFEMEGRSCFDVEVVAKDGSSRHFYFDTKSYLLEFTKNSNESEPLTYGTYADYKVINGLLFYTLTYGMKNGRIYFSSRIKDIQINCPIDNKKFEPF